MADEIDWLDLPGRWTYGVDRGGRIFFINDEDKSTSWVHPGTGWPIQSGHSISPGLPKGWEMDSTQEGAVYFIKAWSVSSGCLRSPCSHLQPREVPRLSH
ncbi:pleckstrin homology domain-containing family A member 7-like [Trichechus inunguis]